MLKKILIFVFVFTVLCVNVYAHSGGTDWRGGHTDSSTGEYHYHHGQPAHQHPNGVCPYEENESDSIQEKVENGTPLTIDEYLEYKGLPPIEEEDVEVEKPAKKENSLLKNIFGLIIGLWWLIPIIVCGIYASFKKKKRE